MKAFPEIKKIIVTGGGGFLGKKICLYLKKKYQVISFSRKKYPELEKMGIQSLQGDLSSLEDITSAAKGCDSMIHTAALAGIWGHPKTFYNTNVIGTKNALRAAQSNNISRFVYTSSPSVVFGSSNIEGQDERIPYAKKSFCTYAHTKKIAEKIVLDHCYRNGLLTSALRPHLIWGPGDPHFIPRLIHKAKNNQLRLVGKGKNLVDVTYVDNAALAHVQLLENLSKNIAVQKKAYFIGQERPINLWEFICKLLQACQCSTFQIKKIPYPIAYALGLACEYMCKTLNIYHKEPPITRFLAMQLSKSHYFCHQQAHCDFGYQPAVTIEEGLNILKQMYMKPQTQGVSSQN